MKGKNLAKIAGIATAIGLGIIGTYSLIKPKESYCNKGSYERVIDDYRNDKYEKSYSNNKFRPDPQLAIF